MKYCSKCGKQLPEEAQICTSCGCPTEPQQTVQQPPNSSRIDSDLPSGNPTLCKITGIISTVLSLLSVFTLPIGVLIIGIGPGFTPPLIAAVLIPGIIFAIAGIALGIISHVSNAKRNTFTLNTDKYGNKKFKADYNLGARALATSIMGLLLNVGTGVTLFIIL